MTASRGDAIPVPQVQVACEWLRSYFALSVGPINHTMRVADVRGEGITVAFDGSLVGGGAIMWRGHLEPQQLEWVQPVSYFAKEWAPEDAALLGIK
eukprot:3789260-Amphidinium_carterae.1